MKPLQRLLEVPTHHDARERDLAADYLGDVLRGTSLEQADADLAVSRLVELLATENDLSVQESALNALADAFDHHELGLQVFEPVVPRMSAMTPALLEYMLYVLSATHDPNARPAIEAFSDHPDAVVRGYVTEALTELLGRHPK
jgi:hypothetical protein